MSGSPAPVRAHPPIARWRDLLDQAAERRARAGSSARAARAELGLPVDEPLIMAGHQASFWHAGILAKYAAAQACAQRWGAQTAWLVVDQDEAEFTPMRVPVHDAQGRLSAMDHAWCAAPDPGMAVCSMGAFDPRPVEWGNRTPALPSVMAGMQRMEAALRSARGEATAGRQVARAGFEVVSGVLEPRPLVFASDLARGAAFAGLVERLRADPVRAAEAYNIAAGSVPEARLAPLRIEAQRGRAELPLWWLETGKARRRVFSDDPAQGPGVILAPRALLMTGFARLCLCDLFIHGTGGGVYDLATERWFAHWLGEALAPAVVVSADLTLPLQAPGPSAQDADRAVWEAQRARHDPARLGLTDLDAQRRELVARVAAARARGDDALQAYRELQAFLAAYRERHAPDLDRLAARAAEMRSLRRELVLAGDRTWACALHEEGALLGVRDALRALVV